MMSKGCVLCAAVTSDDVLRSSKLQVEDAQVRLVLRTLMKILLSIFVRVRVYGCAFIGTRSKLKHII